jgi:hypothetical protein
VLHDSLGLVGLDPLRHHVHDVLHNCRSELKIVVGLGSLLCDHFDKSFRMSALKLPRQQVP